MILSELMDFISFKENSDRAFTSCCSDLHVMTFKCVPSGGVQSVHRERRVGTPSREQQDLDRLHELQSKFHQSPNSEMKSQWHTTEFQSVFRTPLFPVAGGYDSFLPGDNWPHPLARVPAHIFDYILLF